MLRDVFGFHYNDIAAATTARITEQFMTVATTGDLQGLLSLLARDATEPRKPLRRRWC